MSFRFLNNLTYEQLRQFAKDIFSFTGKLPSHENAGLILQMRTQATNLLQDYTEAFARVSDTAAEESVKKCIVTAGKIAALIDLCHQLGYTTASTRSKWILICEDLTKRLYATQKSLK